MVDSSRVAARVPACHCICRESPSAGKDIWRYCHLVAFQPYNPSQPVHATHRNLPHWQQLGATYFVTFRLADSLPASALVHFAELRALNQSATLAWLDRYLDAGTGDCLLSQPTHANLLASTLRHFNGSRYHLGAFAIMPNHVHVIVQPIASHTLTQILHSWKSYTARQLQLTVGIRGSLWQKESFDRIIRHEAELTRITDYIRENPTTARLKPGTYIVA